MKRVSRYLVYTALLGAFAAGGAQAQITFLDTGDYASFVGLSSVPINGATFQTNGGTFVNNGGFGLGINAPGTADNSGEIDLIGNGGGETVTVTWGFLAPIKNFSVALLFNGPEFSDVREKMKVEAFNGLTSVGTGILNTTASNTVATWSFTSANAFNISPADPANPNLAAGFGGWRVDDPFGTLLVNRLVFSAQVHTDCLPGSCSNPSDGVLRGLAVVPEPQTYALFLAGLCAMGFVARRRFAQR